ncbi:MAG: hypothetical protein V4629_03065 [Pseudomonadota bacterium]
MSYSYRYGYSNLSSLAQLNGYPGISANTGAPVISGIDYLNQILTCTTGSWTESPSSYTYQWKASGVDISGATNSTFIGTAATEGLPKTCDVRAVNIAGTSSAATSNTLHYWMPTDLSTDLQAWIDTVDTSNITHVANAVSQISDKSGNSRHFTQATEGSKPTTGAIVGNTNAVTYSTDHVQRTNSSLAQNKPRLYVATVVKPDSTAAVRSIIHLSTNGGAGSSRFVLRLTTGGILQLTGRRLDADTLTSRTGTNNKNGTSFICVAGIEWASANSFARINGVSEIADGAFLTTGNSENLASLAVSIGGRQAADPFLGDIGDFLFFTASSDIADSVIEKIEGYLAHRSGLTSLLDVAHPYKTAAPTP